MFFPRLHRVRNGEDIANSMLPVCVGLNDMCAGWIVLSYVFDRGFESLLFFAIHFMRDEANCRMKLDLTQYLP